MAEQSTSTPAPRFSPKQYDLLLQCSKAGDISDWNAWREGNAEEEILLEGADLRNTNLAGANLWGACMDRAELRQARMEGAVLHLTQLRGANLAGAHLDGAYLAGTHLEQANLAGAHLKGAIFAEAHLEGSDFEAAVVDGGTMLGFCYVDRRTNFALVGLDGARIEPGLKQLLEYNIRRRNWDAWYTRHRVLQYLVKPLWWMSDYGHSTGRVLACFVLFAFFFAALYYAWGLFWPPGLVEDLSEINGNPVPPYIVPVRALYFSVVTMTTLGFGDMRAQPHSFWGHLLMMVHVLMGYMILTALVTRLSTLFQTGGPSAKFVATRPRGR